MNVDNELPCKYWPSWIPEAERRGSEGVWEFVGGPPADENDVINRLGNTSKALLKEHFNDTNLDAAIAPAVAQAITAAKKLHVP